jgi:hypothetical protein
MSEGTLRPDRPLSGVQRFDRFFPTRDTPFRSPSPERGREGPPTSVDLGDWLESSREAIADRWLAEVQARSDGLDGELVDLLKEFFLLITSLLGAGLGTFRADAEVMLQQAAELYGNLGSSRGLAAGEAVEEIQLLRAVLLRFLWATEREEGSAAADLRDVLRLNRMIDVVVTHASVGHTDALFFNLFHGTGVSGAMAPRLLGEVRDQVDGIHNEMLELSLRGGAESTLPPSQ